MLALLVILNLGCFGFIYYFALPNRYAQLMRRPSGKAYNKEYQEAPDASGPKNELSIPEFRFIDRKSDIEWPHRWLEANWRHKVCGVRLFGIVHSLGVAIATLVSVFLAIDGGWDNSDARSQILYGVVPIALALVTTLLFFSLVSPRLGRSFRSGSYLLSGSVLALWLLWALSVLSLLDGNSLWFLPALVYAGVWLPLVAGVWKRVRDHTPNVLLLRVFGSFRRSLLLFEVLEPLWNQVGGVFTVSSSDQAFLRPTTMRRSRLFALAVVWAGLLAAQSVGYATIPEHQTGLRLAAVVLLPVTALASSYLLLGWVASGLFMKDESEVYTPLVKRTDQRNLMGVHKNIHIASHDDDWKLVVDTLASMCDCVLLDLRGFTEDNAGTAYELGFVVNNVRLENVLSLADRTTDLEAVERLFARQWRRMNVNAWNNRPGKRELLIYKLDAIRVPDVFRIAGWLMSKSVRQDLLEKHAESATAGSDDVTLFTWDRGTDGDEWFYLTWLPADHAGFEVCPHGDVSRWQQAHDPMIKRPFTIKTQALGAHDDEGDFWRGMASKVDAVSQDL